VVFNFNKVVPICGSRNNSQYYRPDEEVPKQSVAEAREGLLRVQTKGDLGLHIRESKLSKKNSSNTVSIDASFLDANLLVFN
jgi:hypothetical protein